MGELGVKTLVEHLEKQPVEREDLDGRDDGHAREHGRARDEAASPPSQGRERDAEPFRGEDEEVAGDGDPQGDDARVLEDDPRRGHQGGEELGNVEIVWQGPEKEDDRIEQIQLVQSAVASGVDGIVLAPLDAQALVEPVETAVAKGIPVVIIDSGLESDKIVSYVATDNYHGGVLAAQRMGEAARAARARSSCSVTRWAPRAPSSARRASRTRSPRSSPRSRFLSDSEYAGPTSDSAQQKSQSLVTRYRGQVDGIFCPNETSTVGMLRALEGAGMLAAT